MSLLSIGKSTILFRARVPERRLKNATKLLDRLGMKPGDAFNIFLAQVELHKGLPFAVTTNAPLRLLTDEQQGEEWTRAFGEY